MSKVTLKFVADVIYRDEKIYSNGQIAEVDNSLGFADKWIRRGKAIPAEVAEVETQDAPKKKWEKKKSKQKWDDTPEL